MAVCGTALTPEHVELLQRCDCREVTILFDGDSAGLAAPAKAAAALFPAGLAGKVAVLPAEGGKSDPDEFARAHGRAGVEALLAAATPLSTFLIDRAVDARAAGKPREAPLEAKLAAVRELQPFVRMMPEGLARSVFEDAIAKRLDLDLARAARRARRRAAAAPRRRQAAPRTPRPSSAARRRGPRPARARGGSLLPGPGGRRARAPRRLPGRSGRWRRRRTSPALLPPGPARRPRARPHRGEPVPPEEALARLAAGADAATARRVSDSRARAARPRRRRSGSCARR